MKVNDSKLRLRLNFGDKSILKSSSLDFFTAFQDDNIYLSKQYEKRDFRGLQTRVPLPALRRNCEINQRENDSDEIVSQKRDHCNVVKPQSLIFSDIEDSTRSADISLPKKMAPFSLNAVANEELLCIVRTGSVEKFEVKGSLQFQLNASNYEPHRLEVNFRIATDAAIDQMTANPKYFRDDTSAEVDRYYSFRFPLQQGAYPVLKYVMRPLARSMALSARSSVGVKTNKAMVTVKVALNPIMSKNLEVLSIQASIGNLARFRILGVQFRPGTEGSFNSSTNVVSWPQASNTPSSALNAVLHVDALVEVSEHIDPSITSVAVMVQASYMSQLVTGTAFNIDTESPKLYEDDEANAFKRTSCDFHIETKSKLEYRFM